MRRVRTWAAIAAWISVTHLLSACSLVERFQSVFPPSQLPPAPPGPPEQPPPPQSLAPPSPDEAQAEMTQWLRDHGYKSFQISAILGDARDESGFNPCIQGPGGFSYTFQWAGRRLAQLHEFAHTNGCPQLRVQMAFADWELRNQPQFACFWQATTAGEAYAALRRGFGRGSC